MEVSSFIPKFDADRDAETNWTERSVRSLSLFFVCVWSLPASGGDMQICIAAGAPNSFFGEIELNR